MSSEYVLSLCGFIFVMVGTPGPNNIMLMASGVHIGVRRSLPHIAGIVAGCQLLLVATSLGLAELLTWHAQAINLLRTICVLFLLYMAWRLLTTKSQTQASQSIAKPMTFWHAALFQWVNPKAWMISLALVTAYAQPTNILLGTVWVGLAFVLVGTPLMLAWNAVGVSLRQWLTQGTRLRWFNGVMALLLLASLYPILV